MTRFEKRIRKIAIINFIALVGTLVSLLIFHPLSFIEFAVVGLVGMIVAIFYYLLALLRTPRRATSESVPEGGGS